MPKQKPKAKGPGVSEPVNDLESYQFIEKVIQVVEEAAEETKVPKSIKALINTAQKLLDEKSAREEFGKRICQFIDKGDLKMAKSLINQMREECGQNADLAYWEAYVLFEEDYWS